MPDPLSLSQLQNLGADRITDLVIDPKARDQWLKDQLQWASVNLRSRIDRQLILPEERAVAQQFWALAQKPDQILPQLEAVRKDRGRALLQRARNYVITNFRKVAVNLFQGRKKKKYLTIFAGMGVGAGVGALLGTVIFPGLGTLIGGALGSALSGIVAGIGGALATTTLGAAIGTWLGRRTAKRFVGSKNDYTIKDRLKETLKEQLALDDETMKALQAYIVNRKLSASDDVLKDAIGYLNKSVFRKGTHEGMERLAYYMVQEYETLMALKEPKKQHLKDLDFVKSVLHKFQQAPVLDEAVQATIQAALRGEQTQEIDTLSPDQAATEGVTSEPAHTQSVSIKDSKVSRRQPLRFSEQTNKPTQRMGQSHQQTQPMSQANLDQFESYFQEGVMAKDTQVNHIERKAKVGNNQPGRRKIKYTCQKRSGDAIQLTYRETQNAQQVEAQCYVKNPKENERDQLAKIFAQQAKAYLNVNPEANLVIMSQGKKAWAVSLMAEALKEGLNPQLDDKEFPKQDEGVREAIIREAYEKAGLQSKRRFGFKVN